MWRNVFINVQYLNYYRKITPTPHTGAAPSAHSKQLFNGDTQTFTECAPTENFQSQPSLVSNRIFMFCHFTGCILYPYAYHMSIT
jgi:hypothetical protein